MKRITVTNFQIVQQYVISRCFSCSTVNGTKQWRVERGLPVNRNAEGVLTDGPDFTYLDGRPTPLLHKQKMRILKQQENTERIIQLTSELQFAKERHQNILLDTAKEREQIINNRLKPKGKALKNKH